MVPIEASASGKFTSASATVGTGHHDVRTRVGAEDLRQSGAPVEALRTTRSAKG
jgi:hypothetical protein